MNEKMCATIQYDWYGSGMVTMCILLEGGGGLEKSSMLCTQ